MASLIRGDYVKAYDGTWVRIQSIDVISVQPLQDNWIIGMSVRGFFVHLSYYKEQEEAVKSLNTFIELIIGE